jgi:hypothetical protein
MTDVLITEPGVYDIPADVYHRDPVDGGSLSNSGAKKLMPPSCPALFKAWRDGGSEHRAAFDFGRAAHARVLGVGEPIVVVDADDWRSKAAQTKRDEARAAGHTPILASDNAVIDEMAAKLRAHPIASALLDPDAGKAEQTIVWHDRESGVTCRALVDFLRHPAPGQRYLLPDYKTAAKVDPESISKALWDYGYYGQAAWYSEAVQAAGYSDGPPAFLLVFQMKTPPYLVVVAQVDPDTVGWGHARNRYARDLYRRCVNSDTWPGYADDSVISVQLPVYATYQLEGALKRGELDPEGRVA